MALLRGLAVLVVSVGVGCAPAGQVANERAVSPSSAAAVPVLETAEQPGRGSVGVAGAVRYRTDVVLGGVLGTGSEQLATEVEAELRRRGVEPSADGLLGAAAAEILSEVRAGRGVAQAASEAAVRRSGFAGVLISTAAFDRAVNPALWREALGRVPANVPVNRYAVAAADDGRGVVVVFGSVELTLEPFSSRFELNDVLEVRGEIGARFTFAHVFLTTAEGAVQEKRMADRSVHASFALPRAGKYKLEVMGDGPTGPVIVANVPVFVGAIQPDRPVTAAEHAVPPAEAERRLFERLNQARVAAGVGALVADDELRQIALGHSMDMAEHDFFGHVSPTTGDTTSRVQRAGALVAKFGENLAQSESAEEAEESLMSSPGHRAVMIEPSFTHVGIAAVPSHGALVFTLMFGQRATLANVPKTAAEVQAAFLALRAKHRLSAPAPDEILRAGAEAGVDAYVASADPNSDLPLRVMNATIQREVQRLHAARKAGCSTVTELIDLHQLEQNPMLFDPKLTRFGFAARSLSDAKGPRLAVMMYLEGADCR